MMTFKPEILFYHITKGEMSSVVIQLLQKIYASQKKAVLLVKTPEEMHFYDEILWTYSSDSFLPHGTKDDSFPENQPCCITDTVQNPTSAEMLLLIEPVAWESFDDYQRMIVLFSDKNNQAVINAREIWKNLKEKNENMTYWFQNDAGKWEKKG